MFYEVKNTKKVAKLFDGWEETLIWSCLEQIMGHIFVDNIDHPRSAMAMLGDFCFFAGEPNKELVLYKPDCCKQGFMIMIPQTEAWAGLIELAYPLKHKKTTRYAFKKETGIFDKEMLQKSLNDAPDDVALHRLDKSHFDLAKKENWMRDWVSQYESYEEYKALGALGVVLVKDDEVVSGASSYSCFRGGIEIEIDTKEEYRRNGYAFLCAAKLILLSLEHKKYPSWDAANLTSVSLAKRLGYHFDHEYVAYEIVGY